MNIFIVLGSSGHYDSYREWIEKAFYKEKAAQKYIEDQQIVRGPGNYYDFNGFTIETTELE